MAGPLFHSKKRFICDMKTRTKRIWAIVVCAAALLGWGVLHLANISRRLASEGVETGAVLTSSFTRRVQHGSGA